VYNNSCLWKSISQLRSVACRMGSHSVTSHPTQANTPRGASGRLALDTILKPQQSGRCDWVDLSDYHSINR